MPDTASEIATIAAAVGGSGSIVIPGASAMAHVANRLYPATSVRAFDVTNSPGGVTANQIYYLPPWFIGRAVTFTKAWMYITTASGNVRLAYYNAETYARIAQLGNMAVSSTGWCNLSSLSMSLAKGDKIRIGLNFSNAPTPLWMRPAAAASDNINASLAAEWGQPPSTVFNPSGGDIGATVTEYQSHTYDGSTTPSPMAPTATTASMPAVWFSN